MKNLLITIIVLLSLSGWGQTWTSIHNFQAGASWNHTYNDAIESIDGTHLAIATPLYTGNNLIILAKIDTNGDTLWHKKFNTTGQSAFGIHVLEDTSDKSILIVGEDDFNNNDDMLLIKTDSLGQEIWRYSSQTASIAESLTDLCIANDGNYVGCGS
ncbi:MAG: hypothetical protein MRY83_13550, partial [Flavobacteriales bacterium]|nr:hypothetical protein [Flavobacteriales bacterium]